MAYYEVKAIIEKGKKLPNLVPQETRPPILPNEILVGIMSNEVWAIAANLTDKGNYADFYSSYAKGDWMKMLLYTVPKDEIDNCLEGGRTL